MRAIFFLLFLCGCATATYERSDEHVKISTTRWFWMTQEFDMQWSTEKGEVIVLRLRRSGVETNALAATAEAVARGIVEGIKK